MTRAIRLTGWLVSFVVAIAMNATAGEKITLQLKWKHQFQFAGFYMALEKGYYRDAGLDVTLIEGGQGRSSIEHVAMNRAAYGVTGTGALVERSHGKPIVALGAIFQHSPLVLLVKKTAAIQTITDLRGKRIMLQPGYQNSDIIAALKEAGIGHADYVRQDISYNIQDLVTGSTDAFAAYLTDQPHQLQLLHVPYRLFRPIDQGIDFYGDIIITSDAEVHEHPDRVKAFMQATARGWNDALEHVDETIDLILLKYNTQHLSRDQLLFEATESASLIMQNVVNIGYMNEYRWQRIARVYSDQGLLPPDYRLDGFLYKPVATMGEVVRANLWWVGSLAAAGAFLLLGLHIMMLRRQVSSRTIELSESEANTRKLIELADIGILVHRNGRLLYANPYVLRRMRVSSLDEVLGDEVIQYIHPQDRATFLERTRAVVEEGALFDHVAVRYVNAAQECFEVEVSSLQMQYEGAPAVLTLAQDVTERNRVAREHADMQTKIEHSQRLESLGVLAGGIAHDFNNILTAILGNAAMAERKVLSQPQEAQKFLGQIVVSSERAADLCRQMLAYSGKGKFVIRAINLSVMLEEVSRLLTVSIAKNVTLKYHLADDLPAVEVDVAQMQQVAMNLVINAADAIGEKNGVISISTGVMHVDRDYLLTTCMDDQLPEGRYVYMEVSDTGCGMDRETQSRVFEPFFTTKFTGHGLGMSAVLGIVRSHRGAIKLYSEPGRGSSFKVLLPASGQQAEEVVTQLLPDEPRQPGGTVLIVDDEAAIREAAAMVIEDMGFDTLEAVDGEDGVRVYREHQHEVVAVLLDMTMPKMDGKRCFTELRRINSEVKVILSSGYNEQEATVAFSGQRLAGFLQKPYRPESLQAMLKSIVS
ncbi:response regulator [Mariprofundus erugo]|uniref:histidine kinase n=1 Tax=Mariprofundus erugo TaxID=2528639 RepID=A0A5R9GLG2_9PROT|nr:ABC transporter substrate-binding protein [Mariprofundus erugo]TLS65985.1 response regulator [Mariprofundus erugo]